MFFSNIELYVYMVLVQNPYHVPFLFRFHIPADDNQPLQIVSALLIKFLQEHVCELKW